MTVTVDLDLDASGYIRGVNKAERASGGFAKSVGGLAAGFAGVVAAAGAVAVGVGKVATKMLDVAASVEDSRDKFDTLFGEGSESVNEFAQSWASLVGVTDRTARDILSSTSAIVQGMGYSQDAAAEFSQQIVSVTGDLASFNDVPIEETALAINAALTGEREQLKRLGIVIRETDVQQRAMAMSGKDSAKALTNQEKAAATLELVMERAGVAIGDAARTSDSLTKVLGRIRSSFGNVLDAIAPVIAKALRPMVDWLARLGQYLSDNQDAIAAFAQRWIDSVKAFGGFVIERFADVYNGIRDAVTRIAAALGIGGGGGAGVIGALKVVGQAFMTMQTVVTEALGLIVRIVGTAVAGIIDGLEAVVKLAKGDFKGAWDAAKDAAGAIPQVLDDITTSGATVAERLNDIWAETDKAADGLEITAVSAESAAVGLGNVASTSNAAAAGMGAVSTATARSAEEMSKFNAAMAETPRLSGAAADAAAAAAERTQERLAAEFEKLYKADGPIQKLHLELLEVPEVTLPAIKKESAITFRAVAGHVSTLAGIIGTQLGGVLGGFVSNDIPRFIDAWRSGTANMTEAGLALAQSLGQVFGGIKTSAGKAFAGITEIAGKVLPPPGGTIAQFASALVPAFESMLGAIGSLWESSTDRWVRLNREAGVAITEEMVETQRRIFEMSTAEIEQQMQDHHDRLNRMVDDQRRREIATTPINDGSGGPTDPTGEGGGPQVGGTIPTPPAPEPSMDPNNERTAVAVEALVGLVQGGALGDMAARGMADRVTIGAPAAGFGR